MEETEWLACTDPVEAAPLLRVYYSVETLTRRLRLFGCACARRIWHLLRESSAREMVEIAEFWADGTRTDEDLRAARDTATTAFLNVMVDEDGWDAATQQEHAIDAAHRAVLYLGEALASAPYETCYFAVVAVGCLSGVPNSELLVNAAREEEAAQMVLLRDILGNPFCPISLDHSWQTPTIVSLARTAYDNRTLPIGTLEPDRLAVLADALEDAGCTDANILSHLRGPGLHVRGCCVVDLLLGKK
jgi:hypothetical protein